MLGENQYWNFSQKVQDFFQKYAKSFAETEIRPAEQGIQYVTLMLYHDIKNSDKDRKIKKITEEQEKKNRNKKKALPVPKKYYRQLKTWRLK